MITATRIVEMVRAALPHANLFDAVSLVSGALPEVSFERLARATELPFVGPFAIALMLFIGLVGVFMIWGLAILVVLASVVIAESATQATPILAAIVNYTHMARAWGGL